MMTDSEEKARLMTELTEFMISASLEDLRSMKNDILVKELVLPNRSLNNIYRRSKCLIRYDTLEAAIFDYLPGQILIQFIEICKYGIFHNAGDFFNFIKNYRENCEDNGDFAFTPYQIVINAESQKLVFICHDIRKLEKISKYVKDCLGSDVAISRQDNISEITVCGSDASNYGDATKLFTKLSAFVNRLDKDLVKNIHQIQQQTAIGINYTAGNKSSVIQSQDLETVLKHMTTVCNLTINITGCSDFVVGSQLNKQVVNTREVAVSWVIANPPGERESTTNYYKRYALNVKNPIADNQFGKAVRNNGYEVAKSNGLRYWKK